MGLVTVSFLVSITTVVSGPPEPHQTRSVATMVFLDLPTRNALTL
jgi:hypothetical protein